MNLVNLLWSIWGKPALQILSQGHYSGFRVSECLKINSKKLWWRTSVPRLHDLNKMRRYNLWSHSSHATELKPLWFYSLSIKRIKEKQNNRHLAYISWLKKCGCWPDLTDRQAMKKSHKNSMEEPKLSSFPTFFPPTRGWSEFLSLDNRETKMEAAAQTPWDRESCLHLVVCLGPSTNRQ